MESYIAETLDALPGGAWLKRHQKRWPINGCEIDPDKKRTLIAGGIAVESTNKISPSKLCGDFVV